MRRAYATESISGRWLNYVASLTSCFAVVGLPSSWMAVSGMAAPNTELGQSRMHSSGGTRSKVTCDETETRMLR